MDRRWYLPWFRRNRYKTCLWSVRRLAMNSGPVPCLLRSNKVVRRCLVTVTQIFSLGKVWTFTLKELERLCCSNPPRDPAIASQRFLGRILTVVRVKGGKGGRGETQKDTYITLYWSFTGSGLASSGGISWVSYNEFDGAWIKSVKILWKGDGGSCSNIICRISYNCRHSTYSNVCWESWSTDG